MNNKDMAMVIIEKVGGQNNISNLTHCATRLRFVLKDESKADISALSQIEGVITAQKKGGQIQVVIGAKVDLVYDEVVSITGISGGTVEEDESTQGKRNPLNIFLETISGIFTPILPALIGCGMVQCISTIAKALGWADSTSGFIQVVDMIGACIFYFMPFFLAVSAARKFKTNEFMAICLAACYIHPTILNMESAISFLGLPIPKVTYTSTVIPIILSVFILKYVYSFVNKIIPDVVKVVLVPMVTLIILVPLQLIVLGPIGSYVGSALTGIITMLFGLNGIIAGAVLGFFRPILVMFGMHYSIMPMQIQQVAEIGFTVMLPSAICANIAQAGAAFGVFLKTRNQTTRTASGSASITALFGITEPAIYGVTLRHKKPFFCGCAAAAIASGFMGAVNARAMSIVLPGILSLPNYEANSFTFIIIGVVLAFVLAAAFTYIVGFEDIKE